MRKTELIEILDDKSRDFGKAFLITEMSAFAAERWAMRAGFALMNSGADFSELDGQAMSMQAFAKIGLAALAKIPFDLAEPLIADLMTCVQIIPDPQRIKVVRDIIESDIEEVSTLLRLKKEVWSLHVSFFIVADQSTLDPETSEAVGL